MNPELANLKQDLEEALEKIEALEAEKEMAKKDKKTTEDRLAAIEKVLKEHTHRGDDGSEQISREISLLPDQALRSGKAARFSGRTDDEAGGRHLAFIEAGVDTDNADGFDASQLTVEHQYSTNDSTRQTFFYGFRSPIYIGSRGRVKSGDTTFTQFDYKWRDDELVGAWIIVQDGSGGIDGYKITANTQTTATADGNFTFSGSNKNYTIFVPMYLGAADFPWRRIYVIEGTEGGVRFGLGDTNGGQNGLLYTDSVGDLYWRNKAGTSTKLN